MFPFTDQSGQQVQSLGENALLSRILDWLGSSVLPPPEGPGEDCARIPIKSFNRVITTDPVWYQRHFDETLSPEAVGRKLVVRNLSDLAAAGASPEAALFSLFAPKTLSLLWLERCCRAMGETSRQYGLGIAGGDLAEIPTDFGLNLTVWGTTHAPVPGRSHASSGDTIWVTGRLGGSILGPHWQFTPRLKEGAWLAQTGLLSSMMDISDGLASDIPRLLGKDHQAILNLDRLPLRRESALLANSTGKPDWVHGWADGEDYELLFTLKKETSIEVFQQRWQENFSLPLTQIGEVRKTVESGPPFVFIGDKNPEGLSGYEHFKETL